MDAQASINYNEYTRLPCKTLNKADKASPTIEVLTPHKGVVFVEIKEVDKGLFRRATELDRKTNSVINELWQLEDESKNYLLNQWLNPTKD